MAIELVHIGFNNFLATNRIVALASTDSIIVKRIINEAQTKGLLIDMTRGRKTRAAIVTDSRHIILSAISPEAIAGRLQVSRIESSTEQESPLLKLKPSDEPGD